MCSLRAAVRQQRGLSLLETVLGCALLVLVLGIALPNITNFSRAVERLRAANMAYVLASDIRRVQTLDMYRGRDLYAINFDTIAGVYMLTKGTKALQSYDIKRELNSAWSLRAVNKQNIFYMRGSVNVHNYIDLYRAGDADGFYQIQILPVTGRVGVYKK